MFALIFTLSVLYPILYPYNVRDLTLIPFLFVVPGLSAGAVGLMLAYTINITGVFQQCVRLTTEVENQVRDFIISRSKRDKTLVQGGVMVS